MDPKTPQTFYIHSEGQTVLAFSKDGKKIFTGGSDSLVRSFSTNFELRQKDVPAIEKHSEPVTCLATNKDSFFTGSEDKSSAKFDVHSLTFQNFLHKFPTAIRCMALQPQQSGQRGQEQRQLLAVGCDDCIVRVINIGTSLVTPLSNLRHAPSSLAFHPDGKSLVALTIQGAVALLDPTGTDLPKYSDLLARSCRTDRGDDSCRIAFHPLGKFVAVPASKAGEILLIGSSDLQLVKTLSGGHKQDVTACAWSPNGQFLATTSKDRQLAIWRVGDWTTCLNIQIEAVATCLAWSPIQNMLALTNEDGCLVIFDDILTQAHGFKQAEWAYIHYTTTDEVLELKPKEITASPFTQAPSYLTQHDNTMSVAVPVLAPIQPTPNTKQARFQPAAVQLQASSQILAYNTFGVLKACYAPEKNVYSFESHDGKLMYDFEDEIEYSMGALDRKGIFLAKPASNFNSAELYYRQHRDGSFRLELPKGEDVLTLTTTQYGPIITTSLCYIRYFSCSGIQLAVSMAPSPTPVSLVSDMKDLVFHVFHFAHETGRLRLGYVLYDLRSKSILGQGDLVLASNSILTWIGFTDEGLPAIAESDGLARVLVDPSVPTQASWRPVAEFESHLNHPFGMRKGELHCLQINSGLISTSSIPWSIESSTTLFNSPEVESQYLVSRVFSYMTEENSMATNELQQQHLIEDRLLLKLLLKACQANRPQQAVELILCLNQAQSLEYANVIALRTRQLDVTRRIHDIQREKSAQ